MAADDQSEHVGRESGSRAPIIAMVQAAHAREGDDPGVRVQWRCDSSSDRTILGQAEMTTIGLGVTPT